MVIRRVNIDESQICGDDSACFSRNIDHGILARVVISVEAMGDAIQRVCAGVNDCIVDKLHLCTGPGSAENFVLPTASCGGGVKVEGVVVDPPVKPRLRTQL